jgi:hypothetical protein
LAEGTRTNTERRPFQFAREPAHWKIATLYP